MFITFLIATGLMLVSLFISIGATYSAFFLPFIDYVLVVTIMIFMGILIFIIGYSYGEGKG